jgi:pyruvate/2-oxoacid:ferredoxin oxidoreductase alpha subunit
MAAKPYETTGMVVLQAESEVAAINMVYGGAGCGKKVMTTSSSPGISLKQEGISYIAGAELPCLIVNVVRVAPGLVLYNLHNRIIFRLSREEDMVIIISLFWLRPLYRKWPIL